ncbi:28S ribosomal protein S23, mitochondrial [Varanus komodoensis]|uniref:Small ribosomal subunit protein mS23 n=1 Tax=Varanus komodoensis TaxID=61221 RepID=A0A8D2LX58_VARKO|nr:28S ribosomal protein S23, mitochondrial [Varanus komodoensis]KAF7244296.1 28S ribosomal protein S23, mitochondrial [Varanus komodoensis]
MAGSRLEKLGTIFTRMRNLLRSGLVPESKKPIWYDVYAAFPPLRDPIYRNPNVRIIKIEDKVPAILYPEDEIRAKFYETYGNTPRPFELSRLNFKSTCQRFVEKYYELQKQGKVSEDRLFEETGKALLAEGLLLRRRATGPVTKRAHPEAQPLNPALQMKFHGILEEMVDPVPEEKSSPIGETNEGPLPS